MVLNVPWMSVPNVVTAPTHTAAISAAIRPYSSIVTPRLSSPRFLTARSKRVTIQHPFRVRLQLGEENPDFGMVSRRFQVTAAEGKLAIQLQFSMPMPLAGPAERYEAMAKGRERDRRSAHVCACNMVTRLETLVRPHPAGLAGPQWLPGHTAVAARIALLNSVQCWMTQPPVPEAVQGGCNPEQLGAMQNVR